MNSRENDSQSVRNKLDTVDADYLEELQVDYRVCGSQQVGKPR